MASLIYKYEYLSEDELQGFDRYKYKCVDNSPLSNYVMHPFWNNLVKIVPLWVPANLLTLSGWLCSLLAFLIVSYYDPHFKSSAGENTIPDWVWLLGGISIFVAHQLDGIDGKQARRTNSSSPLGEMFDHGLDSSTVIFMGVGIMSIFGLSEETATAWELTFIVIFVFFAFYIAHWEKYITTVMFLPWAYDISQIWLAGSYVATYVYGIDTWKVSFMDGAFNLPQALKVTLYVLIIVFCVPMSLYNQYIARKENKEECKGFVEGMMPLLSLGSVTLLYILYGLASADNIVEKQLRLYIVAYGILYSNVNCRLIVSQMSGTLCDRFNVLAYPIIPMIILTKLRLVSDYYLIVGYVTFLTLAHLHYGVCVVYLLSEHLNVYVFRVGKPPQKKEVEMNGHSNGYTNGHISNGKVAQD